MAELPVVNASPLVILAKADLLALLKTEVLLAKKRGVLLTARPVVRKLRDAGLYLSDAVVDRTLGLVGE